MSDGRRYVRVYYSIVNDDRFAAIYHDARHLGTWLQLLLVADAMYPADSPLPAYIHRASVRVLVEAGLVEERPHQHFRLHGLASERALRSQSARNANAVRWESVRSAKGIPRIEEKRIEEKTVRNADPVKIDAIIDGIRGTLGTSVGFQPVPKPGGKR
jgi:hypothetical protein